jgi:DNA-binding winged helix-turn-helix (wHTH) protein
MQLPANPCARFRVGEFEVDLRCREVRHNGSTIKLQGNPCQILTELLQRPGEVVTREEIRQKLWPSDTFVDFEHGINTAVNKLRQALRDDAENPRFIETLPRVGYRFIAAVELVEGNGTGAAVVPPSSEQPPTSYLGNRRHVVAVTGAVITLLGIAGLALFSSSVSSRHTGDRSRKLWVQITDFADSATSPALSPDGRMIAFIRGPETFLSPGQIYVKMLPDGQPVQLTHDDSTKMAPAFSPDGSRIAYTATDKRAEWNTWVVPVLGGEPEELLPNAAALTWTDPEHVLFSEIKTGNHMGIATAMESAMFIYQPTWVEWRTAPGYLLMASGFLCRKWTGSGGHHAACFPSMGAASVGPLVQPPRVAPTQVGAQMGRSCTSARMQGTGSISGASVFRTACRNNSRSGRRKKRASPSLPMAAH